MPENPSPEIRRRPKRRRIHLLNRLYSRRGLSLLLICLILLAGWALRVALTPAPSPRAQEPMEASAATAPQQILEVGLLDVPSGLDPHYHSGASARTVMDLLFERLVYLDDEGVPQPDLAQEWQISEDGRSITFRIRPDRRFHDGTPVDAQAVTYTIERILEIQPPHILPLVGSLMDVEAIGARHVTLHFSTPHAGIFSALASPYLGIVSPASADSPEHDFSRAPVGSGPFRLRQWTNGGSLLLERFPHYRTNRRDVENPGPMMLERVMFHPLPELSAQWNALETGTLHVGTAPRPQIVSLTQEEHPSLRLLPWERAHNLTFVEFNHRRPPFDDPRLRHAVAHAIDREAVLEHALFGLGSPATSCLPEGVFPPCPEENVLSALAFDPERAKELLADAGLELSADGDGWSRNGDPLQWLWWTYTTTNVTRATESIVQQLQEVGIGVRSENYELNTLVARLPEGHHDFNIMRWTWSDASMLSALFRGSGWSKNTPDLGLDSLLDRVDTTFDPVERREAIQSVLSALLEPATVLPLFTDWPVDVYRAEVQGLRRNAEGYWLLHDVRLAPAMAE